MDYYIHSEVMSITSSKNFSQKCLGPFPYVFEWRIEKPEKEIKGHLHIILHTSKQTDRHFETFTTSKCILYMKIYMKAKYVADLHWNYE